MAVEQEARLAQVVDHVPGTRSLFLEPAVPLAFRPGQFLSCLLPVAGDTLIRPYSLASDPEEPGRLELLLDLVPGGPGSTYLFGLGPGAPVRFTGPWGTFVLDRAPAVPTVFVADGTGIAPIRPMLHRALATGTGHPLHLLYGVRSPDRAVYAAEFDRLARTHAAFTWTRVPAPDLEAELRRRYLDADTARTRRFFICGIGALVPALRDLLRRGGYERRAVEYEQW